MDRFFGGRSCLLTLILFVITVMPLFAQGNASLGPQVGFHKSRDADNTNVMGGAALRFRFDGLGVEGSLNYREESFDNDNVTVKSFPVMVTGLFYPLPVVYGAIGTGWYNTSIEYNYPGDMSSETKQRVGWHFGGGAELPLGQSAKIVGDIRYVFLDYDFKALPGTNGLNSDFYVVTAGLLFNL